MGATPKLPRIGIIKRTVEIKMTGNVFQEQRGVDNSFFKIFVKRKQTSAENNQPITNQKNCLPEISGGAASLPMYISGVASNRKPQCVYSSKSRTIIKVAINKIIA